MNNGTEHRHRNCGNVGLGTPAPGAGGNTRKSALIHSAHVLVELYSDHATYLKKAEEHGEEAARYLRLLKYDKAVSHARLAASHARRALAIEEQLAR